MKMNIGAKIIESVLFNQNKNQIIYNSEIISNILVVNRTISLAENLVQKKNYLVGQRVLLILRDSPEFIYSFIATILIGCIPVPINPLIKEEELEYILEDSKASHIIIDEDQFERLNKLLLNAKNIQSKDILIREKSSIPLQQIAKVSSINCLIDNNDRSIQLILKDFQNRTNDIAFWQYTSGTTGNPKAVQHGHETMLVNTYSFAKDVLNISKQDTVISISKMFFGYGLGNSLFFPLLLGSTIILDDQWFSVNQVRRIISENQLTVFFGSPKVYVDLLAVDDENFDQELSKIETFISAGAALPNSIRKLWYQRIGKRIVNGIGSTEIGHIFINDKSLNLSIDNVLGKPVQGYKIRLCNPENPEEEILTPDHIGELCISPPYSLSSYWQKEEENARKYIHGWYHSGDLCSKNIDGIYLFHCRKDDLFKINGRWINPLEIENIIMSNVVEVEECIFSYKYDLNRLPTPVLHIVIREDTDKTIIQNKIFSSLKGKLSSYKIPAEIFYLNAFPRNGNGKIDRKKLIIN